MSSCVVHVATTSGHAGFPPTTSSQSSSKVLVGGQPVILHGHTFETHCNSSCHVGTAIAGSSKVIIDGKALCMTGDKLSCGDTIISGSSKLTL